MSDSIAAIRLFTRLERWAPTFPPPNIPGIKRAWNATPNDIVDAADSDTEWSSEGGGNLALEDFRQNWDPDTELVVCSTLPPYAVDPRAQSDNSWLSASAPMFQSASQLLPPASLSTLAPAESPLPASTEIISPPPSPNSAPPILDSEDEREVRHYQEMLHGETGASTCLRTLLSVGTQDAESTQSVAQIVHRLTATSDDLRARFRTEALGMFTLYWREEGAWVQEMHAFSPYILSRGVNIAGFMGSLYRVGLLSGLDAHRCLDALLCTGLHFLKLLAAHALFVQCGDRICAATSAAQTALLKERISARHPDGRFVWGPDEESHVVVLDLLDNIDRWVATQKMKRVVVSPGDTPQNSPQGSAGSSPTFSSVSVMTPRSEPM
ncbi:hypothetical protein FB451DRAFT_1417205 [Mycena latifolia]|nr:hypothetical protein FB451DRAFT_1417205 [Mycena latifolia]